MTCPGRVTMRQAGREGGLLIELFRSELTMEVADPSHG
jgi:hypothetical protein